MTKEAQIDRRNKGERRGGKDRRVEDIPVAVERRQGPRRKTPRRRQIDPTTCERDYSLDEIEFMQALDNYKRASGRMFPTCSEILEVIRALGYVRMREGDGVVEMKQDAVKEDIDLDDAAESTDE